MILRSESRHRRRVLARWIPAADTGFKMLKGTTKSDVMIMSLLKSTVRPWGLNWDSRILSYNVRDTDLP